jgi:hypothetical protein
MIVSLSGCSWLNVKFSDDKPAANKQSDTVGGYYFGYTVNGVSGVQIFDDKQTTYLQLPNGVVIERIWMFVDGLKEEQFFDIENYLVKVPRTSMKSMVLTNRGLFVAERRASLPVNHINQALLNQLLMTQLKSLIAEAMSIKARLASNLEKK